MERATLEASSKQKQNMENRNRHKVYEGMGTHCLC